ncbi:MAG: ABC transporter substrate-binding protein [Candidatus Thiodiazotropha sp.]|nr:ABC transporter substrate-binding protein [Candidatus Thiodiazotropha sp. (ex Codakia orbicularis)]PUB73031.1 MAG: cobalamin ABC transporter substrate-binding protein [gamma proteobacterium symbiont of Ctena orbiculata]PUB79564.1 MAG: cobalamin ABC transporter substrate-binding protein [gamma proteobacterium symbiont of Ctena orbiculata]
MRPTAIGTMLLLLTSLAAATETAPRRVVSVNLCSDQLLLLLADPPQVASVSHLATQPASSFVAEQAARYPLNRARAEEIIRLQPDLILITPHTNPRLRTTLEQLGYPLHRLSLGNRLEDIISDIRKLAARLGQVSRGESLIARMQRRLQPALPDSGKPSPTAIFYQPRGYTSGSGTLQDEALRLAGWNNLAARHGVEGYAPVPLEELLLWQPETLFTSSYAPTGDSLAERQLRHPALKRLLAQRPLREIPYKYWICPGPMLVEAVALLREAREGADR